MFSSCLNSQTSVGFTAIQVLKYGRILIRKLLVSAEKRADCCLSYLPSSPRSYQNKILKQLFQIGMPIVGRQRCVEPCEYLHANFPTDWLTGWLGGGGGGSGGGGGGGGVVTVESECDTGLEWNKLMPGFLAPAAPRNVSNYYWQVFFNP